MKIKKVPLKSEPYFGNISEDNLLKCEELIQSLIFAYTNAEDKKTVEVLQKCCNDLSNAISEELYNKEPEPKEELNPFEKRRIKRKKFCLTKKK